MLRDAAREHPTLLGEPWTQAHWQFLIVFERELALLQQVEQGLGAGARLTVAELRGARLACERLQQTLGHARQLAGPPATVAA